MWIESLDKLMTLGKSLLDQSEKKNSAPPCTYQDRALLGQASSCFNLTLHSNIACPIIFVHFLYKIFHVKYYIYIYTHLDNKNNFHSTNGYGTLPVHFLFISRPWYQLNVVPGANRCFYLKGSAHLSGRWGLLVSWILAGRSCPACMRHPQQQQLWHYVRNQSYIPCYPLAQKQKVLDHEGLVL